MKVRCAKCKVDCKDEGCIFVSGFDAYRLCKLCTDIVNEIGGDDFVSTYMQEDGHEHIENDKNRSILVARLRRAKTHSNWCC